MGEKNINRRFKLFVILICFVSIIFLFLQNVSANQGFFDRANYVFAGKWKVGGGDSSGLTFNPETKTLFIVTDTLKLFEISTNGSALRPSYILLSGFDDTEGIAHIVGNVFAVVQEQRGELALFTVPSTGTSPINYSSARKFIIDSSPGLVGLAYDRDNGFLYTSRENGGVLWRVPISFSSFSESTLENISIGTPVQLTNVQAVLSQNGQKADGLEVDHRLSPFLFVLSKLGHIVKEFDISGDGRVVSNYTLVDEKGVILSGKTEGIAFDEQGNMFIARESSDERLFKYKPTGTAFICNNNGFVDFGEQCDDNNIYNGDGCSNICQVESGWICSGQPSICLFDSDSDGIVDSMDNCPFISNLGQEDLDSDGIGDVCDSQTCGNNVREGTEQCDGNDFAPYSCQTYGFDSGNLSCISTCIIDISSCLDTLPPQIVSYTALVNSVQVVFNELLDNVSSVNISNYVIDNGISIISAVLGNDGKTVTLGTSSHSQGINYTLVINDVKDLAGNRIVGVSLVYQIVAPSCLLAASSLLYMPFDSNEGSVVRDLSGMGNDASVVGAVWNTNGHSGGAIEFSGVNDGYLALNNNAIISNNTDFTLAAWVKRSTLTTKDYIISWRDSGNFNNGIYLDENKRILFELSNSAGVRYLVLTSKGNSLEGVGDTDWHYIAAVRQGRAMRLYRDGVLVGTNENIFVGTLPNSANSFRIGGRIGTDSFDGLLDGVIIFNRALNSIEIQDIYSGMCS